MNSQSFTTAGPVARRAIVRVCAAALGLAVGMGLYALSASAQGQGKFEITKMAEMTVAELPAGELYWMVETFPSLDAAKAAGGAYSLATDYDGKAWLFTLGSGRTDGNGGTKIAEIGPIPRVDAPEYVIRINSAMAPPGAKTKIHTHPGAEAFLILNGQLTQRTPYGQHVLNAGATMPGVPDQPMEVLSTGDEELRELIMFVVDASRPFSSSAELN